MDSSKHGEVAGALGEVDCCALVTKRERGHSLYLVYFNFYFYEGFNVAQAGSELVAKQRMALSF